MSKLEDIEYQILDVFIKTGLHRVSDGKMSVDEAHADIMHVLTAYDRHGSGSSEFMPYMNMRLKGWQDD